MARTNEATDVAGAIPLQRKSLVPTLIQKLASYPISFQRYPPCPTPRQLSLASTGHGPREENMAQVLEKGGDGLLIRNL